VTVSSYLLYLVAALQVISSILAFAFVGDIQAVYDDAFSEVEGGDAVAAFTGGILIGVSVLGLLVGAALVVMAIFNNRGKNASRITTWVVGGIFLCCSGSGLAGQAGGGFNFGGPQDPNMPTNDELQEMLSDAVPSWYLTGSLILTAVGVLALLVALILLALPPSNEFFRKRQPEWQPPVDGQPGYQAYPAYPTVPPPSAPGGAGPAGPAPGGSADPTAPPSDPTAPPSAPDDRPGS
jgi:hypothetical protein